MKKPMKEKRWRKTDSKGSYLVEATLTLPVMILASISLALIINMIAACETIGFVTSCQLKKHLIIENSLFNTVSLCTGLEAEIVDQCPQITDFKIKAVRGGYRSGEIYDLVSITTETSFQVFSSAGIGGEAVFEEKLMARAFTGSVQDASPLNEAAFTQGGSSRQVIIYPKYGERFHKSSCKIVQQQSLDGNSGWMMDAEEANRQGFSPCQVCGGGTH